jgi:hypothetical protein
VQGRALGALSNEGGRGELLSCFVRCSYRVYIVTNRSKGGRAQGKCSNVKRNDRNTAWVTGDEAATGARESGPKRAEKWESAV